MINQFTELAKALGQKQMLDTEQKINNLRTQKQSVNQALDLAIAQEEMVKTEQKAVQNQVKYDEKREKLKADLIKTMVDAQQGQGPVAIGGNLVSQFAPEVAPDAQDLPMIDMNSKI